MHANIRFKRLCDLTTRSLKEHRLLLLLTGIYISSTTLYCIFFFGTPAAIFNFTNSTYFPFLALYLLFFFACRGLFLFIHSSTDKGFPLLWQDLKKNYLSSTRLIYVTPALLAIPFFGNAFSVSKTMIPLFDPFTWDPLFAAWDQALHGGRHPWEWLQFVFGRPLASFLLNILYNAWLAAIYIVLFWQVFSLSRPSLRRQYLLSFCTLWIVLGTVSATFFASAGPCFFDRVTNVPNPYQALMDYLHLTDKTLPLFALDAQNWLWENHVNNHIHFASGISAMPSMHVAIAFLNALIGWRYSKTLGWGLSLFALVIFLGSVHLAWHYAIDGYAAMAGTWLIWHFFGWYEKKHPISSPQDLSVTPIES